MVLIQNNAGCIEVSSVLNLTELSNSTGANGEKAWISSLQCYFMLDKSSSLTPDGINIIACTSGGNWIREGNIDTWKYQANWYIDPVSGNDGYSGSTAETAIKTIGEWYRRTGGSTETKAYINILSDLPIEDPLPPVIDVHSGRLWISGTKTLLATGTVTDFILDDARNDPLNKQMSKLYDSTGDWLNYSGKLIYFVEQDAWARIVEDLTDGYCWVSTPNYQPPDLPPTGVNSEIRTPVAGNTYEVYSIPKVYGSLYQDLQYDTLIVRTVDDGVALIDLDIRSQLGWGVYIYSTEGQLDLYRCNIGADYVSAVVGAIWLTQTMSGGPEGSPDYGSGLLFQAPVDRPIYVDGHVALQDGSGYARCDMIRGGHLVVDRLGIIFAGTGFTLYEGIMWIYGPIVSYNSYATGFVIDQFGKVAFAAGVNPFRTALVGVDNTAWGLYIAPGGSIVRFDQAVVTITGASGDFNVGGQETHMPNLRDYADGYLPSLSACTSWAQLAAAPFNGRVLDYSSNAYMGP